MGVPVLVCSLHTRINWAFFNYTFSHFRCATFFNFISVNFLHIGTFCTNTFYIPQKGILVPKSDHYMHWFWDYNIEPGSQVELARKRGWKGYWVCLKGTTLLFYPCDSQEGRSVEATPKHLIIVDGAIMQAIPEHPKRDFIFCLSTAFGDAYLFQVCRVRRFFGGRRTVFNQSAIWATKTKGILMHMYVCRYTSKS
jgi:hypothetical protein